MRYGFNIQPSCSHNSLLPPKGEGLARAPCLQKTRKRAGFPPWNHPGTGEEGGDASEESLLSSAGTGDTSPGVQGQEFR